MRRLFLLATLIVALCLPVTVHAASVGGAETVGQGKFGISASWDSLNRDEEYTGGIETGPNETLEMDSNVEINRTMVKGSYGLTDNWDVYTLVGTSGIKTKTSWTWSGFGYTESGDITLKGSNGLTYGIGTKVKKEFESGWIIGGDAKYLEHKNDVSGTLTEGAYEESLSGDATFKEAQIAGYVAKKIETFTPYLGAKYSNVKSNYNVNFEDSDDAETFKFSSKETVGVFLGTDWTLNEVWTLNVEARFRDEEAIFVELGCKF